jgi:hypothetical protein
MTRKPYKLSCIFSSIEMVRKLILIFCKENEYDATIQT